jgi:xylulokinase
MNYVIGCDVGSQGTRAALVSFEGRVAGEASSEYGIDFPHPLWAEQPVERWIKALTIAIRRVMDSTGIRPQAVKAIALAAQVDGVVAIDAAGTALRPGIIWMDRRAGAQCDVVRARLGNDRAFELTGLNLDPVHVGPKIRWLADTYPGLYSQTTNFLLPGSYLAYYLTGEIAVDYSNASSSLLFDVATKAWSPEMCQAFDIWPERLADIYRSTAVMGTLRPAVADALGLHPDTLMMVGCGDEHAACLGAGIVRDGLVGDIAGTAEPVCAASTSLAFDDTRLVETHCHADPDLWLIENPGFVSGGNYRWFREQFASGTPYSSLDAEAAAVVEGAEGLIFLPSLMGAMAPTWNEHARGTFAGFTLGHTRGHFVRALLEGSAFAVRDITDRMQAMGLGLTEMRVMGGGARSSLWNQIKADATGLPVTVPAITETTALGAAMLALVGAGAHATLAEAAGQLVQLQQHFDPRATVQKNYQDVYARYRETYFSLLPVYARGK